jgi:ABC-type sugar transport system ATPase subunit
VTLGVRPQSIAVAPPGEPESLRGTVEVVEPIPSDRIQLVHLLVGDGNAPVEITASVPIENRVQRGDEVAVRLGPTGLHLFDPVTELSLTPE